MNITRSEELSKSMEHHIEQYIKHLRLLHETQTSAALAVPSPRTLSNEWSGNGSPSPPMRAGSVFGGPSQSSAAHERSRRPTNESPKSRPILVPEGTTGEEVEFLPLTSPGRPRSSLDNFFPPYVTRPLEQESFNEEALVAHLKSIDESKSDTVTALSDAWLKRDEVDATNILTSFETGEGSRYENASYHFYEVGENGILDQKLSHFEAPQPNSNVAMEGDNQDAAVWEVLKEVNKGGKAVGRISILQEPSPLMMTATHMTMKKHFDMDELLQHLVSTSGNKGKTKAYMNRATETDPLRQRSFFFVFKYYTVVEEGLKPAPWQPFDVRPPDRRSPDHIDITECSSVLALSLGGDSIGQIPVRVKRRTKPGYLYDSFAPWHLLNIQCFPDDKHSTRSEDSKKRFCNGPHAFLDALCIEYRDAVKRYTELNESITKLITPPNHFMFDVTLRDKLLFEDSHFTYSRRYFWAYNTLGVINEGIKSMSAAYLNTFTKEFWAGKHPTLWPHPNPDSDEGKEYIYSIYTLRGELEAAVGELKVMCDKNEATRTEIRSLREQLFSGSSVKESRRAIEQGDNIKILTSVSMIFLPLTFVVGVFGITTFDISAEDWRFPVTMVSVCIPFFILILVLQTRAAMMMVRKFGRAMEYYFSQGLGSLGLGGSSSAAAGEKRRHSSWHSSHGNHHPSYHPPPSHQGGISELSGASGGAHGSGIAGVRRVQSGGLSSLNNKSSGKAMKEKVLGWLEAATTPIGWAKDGAATLGKALPTWGIKMRARGEESEASMMEKGVSSGGDTIEGTRG
ncbi:hypothetical protein QBC35DRAFT_373917 [Podospora australis]|uniref:Uncharacterized protein n=1 Tax=Podospora australis TaxID=1536484 RepID=A0AAN6X241_9PEZI|nr:hypothetical protein QBC35DRAFT_373917 [Podospora australis]